MYKAVFVFFLCLAALLGAQSFDLDQGDFILGFYSADNPNDTNFPLIRHSGINYVHTYGLGDDDEQSLARAKRFLDLAEKWGMKVMFNLRGQKWVNPEFGVEGMLKMAKNFADHPALGMWYLYDEPKPELVPKLEEIRDALHKLTPNIPTSLVIHWIKDWSKTRTACDLWMVDLYPVRNQEYPDSKLNNYTKYVRAATRCKDPAKPIIGVMQSYSWDCMREQLDHGPDAKYRFPNMIEMRNMAFASIAMGVRGLFFYSFYHIHVTPINTSYHKALVPNMDWYLDLFTPFCREVKEFTSIVPQSWKLTAYDDSLNTEQQVFVGYWQREKGDFLVLTNDSKEKREISVRLDPDEKFPLQGSLVPWGQTRQAHATLADSLLTVKAEPWEAFVWEIK